MLYPNALETLLHRWFSGGKHDRDFKDVRHGTNKDCQVVCQVVDL